MTEATKDNRKSVHCFHRRTVSLIPGKMTGVDHRSLASELE